MHVLQELMRGQVSQIKLINGYCRLISEMAHSQPNFWSLNNKPVCLHHNCHHNVTLKCCPDVRDLQCASHNSTQYDEAAQQQENQCCEVSLSYATRGPPNPISC